MEYFMVPAQKVPSLQHFRKTEKDVIGGLCRYVQVAPRVTQHAAIIARSHLFWGGAHAPKGNMLHPALLCYCVHDPLAGRSGKLISVKCWLLHADPLERELLLTSPAPDPGVLFGIFECEIDVFCGEQTQTTWLRGHHAATPAPRRIPSALCYPRFTPLLASPVSPIGCSDLRATSYTRAGWKVKERGGGSSLRYCG